MGALPAFVLAGAVLWLTWSAAWADSKDLEPERSELSTRLVPLESAYVPGHSMRFRLELVNSGNSPADIALPPHDVTTLSSTVVSSADGINLPSIFCGDYQTLTRTGWSGYPKRSLQPGEVVILVSELDIAIKHRVIAPGRYRAQFQCHDSDCDAVPQSNTVEINVAAGLPNSLDQALGHLLEVKPSGWRVRFATQGSVKPRGRTEVKGMLVGVGSANMAWRICGYMVHG